MRRPTRPLITLTTDFGEADVYVAAMKGVILGINPNVTLVDITHSISPQNIEQAVFLLSSAWPHFPEGTIHIAVIDPGVGSERRALLLVGPMGYYIGPDNGVLSAALPDAARPAVHGSSALPDGYEAVALTNPAYFHHPVSTTFHGRDIFAPVAAHLSLGVAPAAFGEMVREIIALPPLRAPRAADGSLYGRVVHIDRFGNLVTNIRAEDLPPSPVIIEVGGHSVHGISRYYHEGPDLLALIGSSGYLEVAQRNGSAAARLGVGLGAEVVVASTGETV